MKWFGDDGRIMALPDPIKESSSRPPLFHLEEELDPALQTVYRKVFRSVNIMSIKRCIHVEKKTSVFVQSVVDFIRCNFSLCRR